MWTNRSRGKKIVVERAVGQDITLIQRPSDAIRAITETYIDSPHHFANRIKRRKTFKMTQPINVLSVQSLSRVQLFATPWTAARQASLSITNSRSLLKLMSIKSVMPPTHLILCRPLLLLPSIFASIRIFSNWVSSHQVAKVLKLQLQHQYFQWIFRTDFL